MELNYLYIGWIAFGAISAIAIQLYFFRPKSFSEEYESKINEICAVIKNRLFTEIDELYTKKQQIQSQSIQTEKVFPEIKEDLVLYKLDDVLYFSSKYNKWNDALKNGKNYLKGMGKGAFFFSLIVLFVFSALAFISNIDMILVFAFIYLSSFPAGYLFLTARDYDRLTRQIDECYGLIKKGDLQTLLKRQNETELKKKKSDKI